MFSSKSFDRNYETDTKEVVIRGKRFNVLVPESLDGFVDPEDIFHDFPLWSKLWEASIVLADYLARITPDPQKRFLEIGSGLGLVGVVAASFGHQVTMTEYNPDALNFARANAHNNGLDERGDLEIKALDWNRPRLEGSFTYIVGSEILYSEKDYEPLLDLFKTYLRPGGEIILAERARKTSIGFFREVSEIFEIEARKKVLRSREKEIFVILARMKFQ
ncbi:MAG: methyltransferase domain-containing protein [Desulfobacteraceae bacterium]|nr:methyltransferase domain-containing protein [Desulfobacteraceae bacterium]